MSALCVLLLAGCESGDSSTPAGPTPLPLQSLGPPDTADVSGTWTATLSASTDDIVGGGCLGNVARALGLTKTWTSTIEITQSGSTLSDTSVTIGDISCTFSGSVSGTTVNATVNACTPDSVSIGEVSGCGSDPWSLESLSLSVAATVSDSTITGTPTATATAVSGSNSHAVSATGSLSMTR